MEIIFSEIDEIICPCCGSKINKGDICFGCGYNNIPNILNNAIKDKDGEQYGKS